MSDLKINDLMSGHNPHQELLKQTRKLVDKWEPTGLLDDIEDSTKKTGMAVLLENQATQLIKEASKHFGAQCIIVEVHAKKLDKKKWEVFLLNQSCRMLSFRSTRVHSK